ncbi:MAG: PglZ domain-containing protein [Actinomycetota bacterium]
MVVIDPEFVVHPEEVVEAHHPCETYEVQDWFELRRTWELHGRRPSGQSRLVLMVRDRRVLTEADLPFDISTRTSVRRLRLPVPPGLQPALLALDDLSSDAAVAAVVAGVAAPSDVILSVAAGMPPGRIAGGPQELVVALRLRARSHAPRLFATARERFADSLALAAVAEPPDMHALQSAWDEWVLDPAGSRWARHLDLARAELIELFLSGQLHPTMASNEALPPWATVGIAQPSPRSKVEALLDECPDPAASLDGWSRVAQWWGEVRSGLAQIVPADKQLEARAWDWWVAADGPFLAWLRSSYGRELSRAWANWPASLDKVQPFLAKRRGSSGRILLVVLDGMGFPQWSRLRELVQPTVLEAGGVLAMLPTLTEVSRQAIAAGTLPIHFPDSIRTTSKEALRWTAAWQGAGVKATWVRIDGARHDELEVIPFGYADAIGVVLSITDELMHSNDLLGDVGVHTGLEAWARAGVFHALLVRAAEHGYDPWVTADHGNLAVQRTKELREGEFVERAGTRARRYASKVLRDASAVDGIVWDDLPGYPRDEAERLLFADGRGGWGASGLAHGGLSLDEVIVPLVRVEPAQ